MQHNHVRARIEENELSPLGVIQSTNIRDE